MPAPLQGSGKGVGPLYSSNCLNLRKKFPKGCAQSKEGMRGYRGGQLLEVSRADASVRGRSQAVHTSGGVRRVRV